MRPLLSNISNLKEFSREKEKLPAQEDLLCPESTRKVFGTFCEKSGIFLANFFGCRYINKKN